jgi:hypothetical protein
LSPPHAISIAAFDPQRRADARRIRSPSCARPAHARRSRQGSRA